MKEAQEDGPGRNYRKEKEQDERLERNYRK